MFLGGLVLAAMRSLSASTTFDLRLGSLQVSLVQQLIIIIKVMMIKVIMIMVRLLVVMMISIKTNIMKSAPTTSDLQPRSLQVSP